MTPRGFAPTARAWGPWASSASTLTVTSEGCSTKRRRRTPVTVATATRERVDAVIDQCGLGDVSKRIIGQLSRGYKQRVGLADALVHEPELIILDEPTVGLDPSQIRSVRQLIKSLRPAHTVLISSHILTELSGFCNKAAIMERGRLGWGTARHKCRG